MKPLWILFNVPMALLRVKLIRGQIRKSGFLNSWRCCLTLLFHAVLGLYLWTLDHTKLSWFEMYHNPVTLYCVQWRGSDVLFVSVPFHLNKISKKNRMSRLINIQVKQLQHFILWFFSQGVESAQESPLNLIQPLNYSIIISLFFLSFTD